MLNINNFIIGYTRIAARQSRKLIFLLTFILPFLTCCTNHRYTLQGYIEGQFIYLSSSASGDLKKLLVYRGNSIKANQTIFILDPYPEKAQLEQAAAQLLSAQENLQNALAGQRETIIKGLEAQIAQAQSDLTFSRQTLERNQALYKTHVVEKAALDQAVSNYNHNLQGVKVLEENLAEAKLGSREHVIAAQRASVQAALAQVAQSKWLLEQKTVHSPFDAKVVETFFQEGEFVPSGQAVAQILPPFDIKVIFFVPEAILSRIKLGQNISFGCDSCKSRSIATIDYIAPQSEYTPPIIYSHEIRYSLVYRVEAAMDPNVAVKFNPGQPVDVVVGG